MKRISEIFSKRFAVTALAALLALALLNGCVPTRYSGGQEKALVDACMPAVEEFLAKRYEKYTLGEFHLLKGLIAPEKPLEGNYGSNVVRGSYTVEGNTWELVYDRESGSFYTSELHEKLMKQEERRMLEYLKAELPNKDLRDFRVTVLDYFYMVQSHDIKIAGSDKTADTYVYINDVLPAGITEKELPAFAERGFDGGTVSKVRCHYVSDREKALTEEAFERFFADNPAYQVGKYLFIENDNSSAEKGSESSSAERIR